MDFVLSSAADTTGWCGFRFSATSLRLRDICALSDKSRSLEKALFEIVRCSVPYEPGMQGKASGSKWLLGGCSSSRPLELLQLREIHKKRVVNGDGALPAGLILVGFGLIFAAR